MIKYMARVLGGVRLDKLNTCINDVHNKSGKNKVAIFFDMVGCVLKYGAGYYDYAIFEYYNMTPDIRKTYLTRVKNKKLVTSLNDPEYAKIFDDKNAFNEAFKDFLGRKAIDIHKASPEDVKKYIEGKEYVIAKPNHGECGHGIEKLKISSFGNFESFYSYITAPGKKLGLLDELIVQHSDMAKLYPDSINCMRIVTLLHENVAHILYVVLKTGNNGKFVDNLESGGFACHVNLETGVVCGPGHNNKMELIDAHPATGMKFKGFKIPFYEEALELVKKAAFVVPQVQYIGWDVCITPDGPAIIEGNNYAAYDFPQMPDEGRPKYGLLKQIEDIGIKL